MIQRRENELDALFKRKLEDLDMGRQEHMWQGIADQLSKNKRSNRLIGFAWFSGVLLSFTILGLGITTAYKYNLEKETERAQSANSKTKVAHSLIEQPNVNQSVGTEIGQIQTQKQTLNLVNEVQNSSELSKTTTKSKDIKNYNINSVVNQVNSVNLSNTQVQNISSSKLALGTNINQKTSQSKLLNSSNEFSYIIPSNTESSNQELISNPQNSNATKLIVVNENLVELNSESYLSPNAKIEEFSFLNTNKKNEAISKNIKSNFKRLKLPINDYCLSKNLTPLDHFDIDLYYSPEIATRTITARSEAATPYAQKRAGSESFSGASTFGLRLSYVTKSGLALRTGVNLSSISEKFEYFDGKETVTKIIYDQFNKPIDTIYTTVDKIVNQKNVYKFIDIPILVGYEMDISDFVFSFNAGLGLNISTNYYGSIYAQNGMDRIGFNDIYNDNGVEKSFFRRNVGTSLLASFGLNYKLNGRFLLLAEPNLRYYLNSLTTDNYPLDQRYLQLGIAVGLRYRFY